MPPDVEIRRVGPGDEALFGRVAIDVFDGPVVPARLTAYLASADHLMVVALSGGEVVGQVAGVIHRHPDLPTELYVDNLGVTPTRQRQGIGRQLVETLFMLGRRLGCEEAWVGTEVDNAPARGLYRALGAEAETFVLYFYDL